MNIYLDIDGVLLVNGNQLANHADEFLQSILKKYPDTTYWLTTYDRNGGNRAKEVLTPHLQPETVALLDKVKSSKWSDLKTDAIDFDQDFLWFDDNLWPDELNALEKNQAIERFVLVDLAKSPDLLHELAQVVDSFSS